MNDVKCDIIVLTWNQKKIIQTFVKSFLDNTTVKCRLIIIDNGSSDGTKEYLQTLQDTPLCNFKIIINQDNKGFVGGMNLGIEVSTAPYVCLANNDLLFTNGWLEEIVSVFESNKNIGVLNPNSNNLGLFPSKGESIETLAGKLIKSRKSIFIEMPFCIGFCMFIRREVIQKVGGLSKEFYPIFFEDTDYSVKASREGYLLGSAAGSYVWHDEHASFKQMGEKRRVFFVNSRGVFEKKWGRILRIAWIEGSSEDLANDLKQGISLARNTNYLTFYNKNFDVSRDAIFKSQNTFEHSGVQFKKFSSYFWLVLHFVVKKKKFDLVITKNKTMSFVLNIIGQKAANFCDEALIAKIKKVK